MKIVHRIGVALSEVPRARLAEVGVFPGKDWAGVAAFDISESDDRWPAIERLLEEVTASDIVTTKFTEREETSAEWLVLEPDWHCGYPQPDEDEFGYRAATYDLTDYCEKCGIGARQIAPFQMKGEPKWGERNILQMNWVFDEYFVTPEVWERVFRPFGIPSRPVLRSKNHQELESVVQLVLSDEATVDHGCLKPTECPCCSRIKYEPFVRGFFPRLFEAPKGPMGRTLEWFGTGGRAFREVLISQQLRAKMKEKSVRGASFWPVASEGCS